MWKRLNRVWKRLNRVWNKLNRVWKRSLWVEVEGYALVEMEMWK